jgi:hypothetical protein
VSGLRPPHDFADNITVRAVHAVKVTDAHECGTEVARDVVEFVKDLHLYLVEFEILYR